MKNGSIEFVAVMAEKFKCYVEPYIYYEFTENYEDLGFPGNLTSPRVLKEDTRSLQRQRVAKEGKGRCQKYKEQDCWGW